MHIFLSWPNLGLDFTHTGGLLLPESQSPETERVENPEINTEKPGKIDRR